MKLENIKDKGMELISALAESSADRQQGRICCTFLYQPIVPKVLSDKELDEQAR